MPQNIIKGKNLYKILGPLSPHLIRNIYRTFWDIEFLGQLEKAGKSGERTIGQFKSGCHLSCHFGCPFVSCHSERGEESKGVIICTEVFKVLEDRRENG